LLTPSKTQAEFRYNGLRFKPEKGTYKLVYLEPGDTIIMRCGFPVMHSVLTLDDSIMAGGIYWCGIVVLTLYIGIDADYPTGRQTRSIIS
jgi:hypothetical protein